ncbi:hypothetical protein [Streptosporangium roseum]|uniref:Ig-like domain-containing protein n=1 Tax=Streptosporangium roseum (strain ATCC 12428 / DSM 43021 / JCM 3005 / KCTC 9067 / NCIMB 10171 / NRRL 2505 / NI 9100) TaxID=479432 RepID=D2B710_STRRD|nr:hypothetical protein [Streptosporangium roseum]ACZ87748.1 hypothetical protein Sros_4942 [Streptosporangium roseum DSM 43021]
MITRRRIGAIALAVALATVTGSAVAAPVSATSASALGCQSTYATLNTYGGPLSWNCHGSHTIAPSISASFSAGGWSGAVYSIEYAPRYFCDGDSFGLGDRKVYEVYLNETKPARCK